jgi:hypothetical protein
MLTFLSVIMFEADLGELWRISGKLAFIGA